MLKSNMSRVPTISGKKLCQWRRDIYIHYPIIYPSNKEEFAAIYGNDGGPHGYGTKICCNGGIAKLFDEWRCHWAYYVIHDGRTKELCKI
jgi:hypothetical protein